MHKLPVFEDTKVGIPTSVYKYFDSRGILIYVGITSGGILRQRQHNDSKEWWPFVHRQEVEHFKSRGLAHEREVSLIEQFRPPFNKQHNKDHVAARLFYLDLDEGYLTIPRNAPIGNPLSLDLRALTSDHNTREVEFVAPYRGECSSLKMVADPKIAPAYDQNDRYLGQVVRIEKPGLFVSVFVKLKRPEYLNHRIDSAVGYLKQVLTKNKPDGFVFKRIDAVVVPPLRQSAA